MPLTPRRSLTPRPSSLGTHPPTGYFSCLGNPYLKHPLTIALLLAACACRRDAGGTSGADTSSVRDARAIPAVAFRIPRGGGAIAVYALPALDRMPWGLARVTGASASVGVDLFGRRLLYRDTTGAVTAFDLVALRERRIAPPRSLATVGADGALLTVDSAGGITESQPWGTRTWPGSLGRGVRAVFAAPGPRLLAVREAGGESLQVASRESGIMVSHAVPGARARAASRDGDAVAFAIEDGVVVFEDRKMDEPWTLRLRGGPRALAFSPSGHRLYVALGDRSALAVVDRFAREERAAIALPGAAVDLRMDPWGRAILVRGGEGGDAETWVVSVAEGEVTGRFVGAWATDLPTVSEDGVLLLREADAVVARDVRSLDSLGAVEDAAGDVWLTGRWLPASASAAARARAAESSRPAVATAPPPPRTPAPAPATPAAATPKSEALSPPSAPTRAPEKPVTTPPPASTTTFYVQLSATRNESAARALVDILAQEQQRAEAVAPAPGDDMWRVMSGPFRSREAADSAGRSMGRAYWVVERGGGRRP